MRIRKKLEPRSRGLFRSTAAKNGTMIVTGNQIAANTNVTRSDRHTSGSASSFW